MVSECFKIPARLKMPAVFSSSETAREATKQMRRADETGTKCLYGNFNGNGMPAPSQVAYMFYQLTTSR